MERLTKDYINDFDCNVYLNSFCKDPKLEPFVLQCLHKFWNSIGESDQLRVLEYGGGPNISRLISACPRAQSIVLAEYAGHLRHAVQAWLDKDASAFDWSATFEYIVQELEGKEAETVAGRQEELRRKLRAIVPCDLTKEKLLEIPSSLADQYGPPYDVVATCLCLEAVVESEKEYKDVVAKLAGFVKRGGYLVMHAVIQQTYYIVGDKKFYTFYLTRKMVEESLREAGGTILEVDMATNQTDTSSYPLLSDQKDVMFVYARF